MKRARATKDTLTGGTGDVNPQLYNLSTSTPSPGPDGAAQTKFPVPVYRFPLKNDRAMVMEVLRVKWVVNNFSAIANQTSLVAMLSTANIDLDPTPTENNQFDSLSSANVFDAISIDGIYASAVGFAYTSRIIDHDLTDSAGHGILVATDNIYIGISSINTGAINEVTAKITYRWKMVSLAEYIGIVQGQQNPS